MASKLCLVPFFSALLLFPGCSQGPKLVSVEGAVTYQGKLVPMGSIVFVPSNGGPNAEGNIGKDGKFHLLTRDLGPGAVIGEHKVMIIALEDSPGLLPEDTRPLKPPLIPIKYSDLNQSGLTAKVEDKANVINFDLK
ncbi:MAG: hypothetical protein EXR99_06245 [Gemmataceae bacterium]|nr:hypothetical protein [Gemmataceae bacterium]